MNESPIDSFKNRFNKAISMRNIKPTELAEKTKLSKSTISHYMSGYTKPKSDKLFILSNALNVNEQWLMGLDVPMEKDYYSQFLTPHTICFEITARSLQYSPEIYAVLCDSFKDLVFKIDDFIFKKNNKSYDNAYELLISPDLSYEEKATLLNSVIDFAIYDTKNDKLRIFYVPEKKRMKNYYKTSHLIAKN